MLQGARQQGIKEHVKVKKKHDATGVGAVYTLTRMRLCSAFLHTPPACIIHTLILVSLLLLTSCCCCLQLEAIAKARDWTAGMAAYDLVLAKMKPVTAAADTPEQEPPASGRKKKRKQPEPASEPVEANVLVAAASKPQKIKKSKKKTKGQPQLDTETAPQSDAAASPGPISALKAVAEAQPHTQIVPLKAVTAAKGRHIGRYHRVAAAKKAKGYSSSDLAAILGVESLPAAAPAAVVAQPTIAQVCTHIKQRTALSWQGHVCHYLVVVSMCLLTQQVCLWRTNTEVWTHC